MYSEPSESTRFLTFESQLKKLSCSILLLLAIYVQNTFKILHLGIRFVSDLALVGEVKYIASCNILAVNNNQVKYFPQKLLFCHENNQL